MDERSPFDGKPYYCNVCGLGFGEYMACEEADCELEPASTAESRRLTRSQESLSFGDGDAPIARTSDPDTSHRAGERHTKLGKRAERARQVLDLLHHNPDRTAGELSVLFWRENKRLGIRVAAATPHKRLPDLEKKGLVTRVAERKCEDSGEECTVWRVTESGVEELTNDLPF